MRGRTNIITNGGNNNTSAIINGEISEYQVAETEGISAGDFVEIDGAVDIVTTDIGGSNYGTVSEPIKLPDGKIAYAFVSDKGYTVRTIELSSTGFCTDTTQLFVPSFNGNEKYSGSSAYWTSQGANGYRSAMCAYNDAILIICTKLYDSYIYSHPTSYAVLLKYSNNSWDMIELTVENDPLLSMNYSSLVHFKDDIYIYNTNKYIVACKLAGDALTFGEIYSTTSSFSVIGSLYLGKINLAVCNGYIVNIIDSGATLCTYLVNDNLSITKVDEITRSESTAFFSTPICTSDNDLIYFAYNTNNTGGYIAYVKDDGSSKIMYYNAYVYVVSISNLGNISFVKSELQIPLFNGAYSSSVYSHGYFNSLNKFGNFISDTQMVIVFTNDTVMSSSTSYSTTPLYSLATLSYNKSTKTVSVIDYFCSNSINEDIISSAGSGYYGRTYAKYVLSPIVCENDVIFAGIENFYYLNTSYYTEKLQGRCFLFKVEQGLIQGLVEYPIIKKYFSRINGIAKTSGSNGDVIEVYTPYNN